MIGTYCMSHVQSVMFSWFRDGPYTNQPLNSGYSLTSFIEGLDQNCKHHLFSNEPPCKQITEEENCLITTCTYDKIHMQLSKMYRCLVMARERSTLQNISQSTDVG